ncbi:hypothetical protein [Pseudomonas asplenii]|uniref:Uncharacterized protein n=1 Tax=Pseudomonas asplenii TaxID=53407 RepID=A0A1H6NYP0_9PSED|nr:hypothetical protein [Pseudomonas fuscovaginae]SEI17026.1 hypothetical protein SAMN05216581_3289 [Pseudomonas fuscovaginae]
MSRQFYLQDSRSNAYVGDGLSFWAVDGKGYVTDLAKAELYTAEQATSHRDTDIPWPKDYIDARTRIGVDCQYVDIREALDQHPDAAEFYMQKPKDWNGNNLIWLMADGGFTSDLRKAVRVARADTISMIGRCGQTGGVAWPCAYIDAHSRRLVERDDVNLEQALRGTGIKLPKPKKPRMMMFNCHGCGRFISDRQRFEHNCWNCGADNRP